MKGTLSYISPNSYSDLLLKEKEKKAGKSHNSLQIQFLSIFSVISGIHNFILGCIQWKDIHR